LFLWVLRELLPLQQGLRRFKGLIKT